MKKLLALLLSLTTTATFAARICQDYIDDEWPDSRYGVDVISGDNVVIDLKTDLMWIQCSEGLSGVDCNTGTASTHTWQQALELTDNVDFAGYTDWRLPNAEELLSLASINCYAPAINETTFPNTSSSRYWTSSPIAGSTTIAWFVGFDKGKGNSAARSIEYHVRLVRSLQ